MSPNYIRAHNYKEQAFDWLNRAYEERNSGLPFLKTYAQFDSLRSALKFLHWKQIEGEAQNELPLAYGRA